MWLAPTKVPRRFSGSQSHEGSTKPHEPPPRSHEAPRRSHEAPRSPTKPHEAPRSPTKPHDCEPHIGILVGMPPFGNSTKSLQIPKVVCLQDLLGLQLLPRSGQTAGSGGLRFVCQKAMLSWVHRLQPGVDWAEHDATFLQPGCCVLSLSVSFCGSLLRPGSCSKRSTSSKSPGPGGHVHV